VALARAGRAPAPWTLYPGEYGIYDRRTRCQFYYHSHAGVEHEDGHFHTVCLFPDHTVHVVAISMAPSGWPQALFTVNLWAIGDAYESAGNLRRYVRRFHLREKVGPPRLVRFVNLMFRAFEPEIERLQEEKIAALARHRAAHPGRDIFDDRSLEVLSRIEVDARMRAGDLETISRF
jgi:hypothetical protein